MSASSKGRAAKGAAAVRACPVGPAQGGLRRDPQSPHGGPVLPVPVPPPHRLAGSCASPGGQPSGEGWVESARHGPFTLRKQKTSKYGHHPEISCYIAYIELIFKYLKLMLPAVFVTHSDLPMDTQVGGSCYIMKWFLKFRHTSIYTSLFYKMILYPNQPPGSIVPIFCVFPFLCLCCFSKHILRE